MLRLTVVAVQERHLHGGSRRGHRQARRRRRAARAPTAAAAAAAAARRRSAAAPRPASRARAAPEPVVAPPEPELLAPGPVLPPEELPEPPPAFATPPVPAVCGCHGVEGNVASPPHPTGPTKAVLRTRRGSRARAVRRMPSPFCKARSRARGRCPGHPAILQTCSSTGPCVSHSAKLALAARAGCHAARRGDNGATRPRLWVRCDPATFRLGSRTGLG